MAALPRVTQVRLAGEGARLGVQVGRSQASLRKRESCQLLSLGSGTVVDLGVEQTVELHS